MLKGGYAASSRTDLRLVEMTNGCICSPLREDLHIEIKKLACEDTYDYLAIESTGISQPLPVAETFTSEDENGASLGDVAILDTMVTVVDAESFLRDCQVSEDLAERDDGADEGDERTASDLLVDQMEFVDVPVISKIDRVDGRTVSEVCAMLQKLNPEGKILLCTHGQVAHGEILSTGLFSFIRAFNSVGWLKKLRGDPKSEADGYGLSSFIFWARRPIHSQRLASHILDAISNGLVRSKGFIRLATRPIEQGILAFAGSSCFFDVRWSMAC